MTYDAEWRRQREREAERQAEGLGFFAASDWPESPPERTEQAVIPIPGATIQGRWEAWLETEDGGRMFARFCVEARQDVALGARLSAKNIWERVRSTMKIKANNSYTPLAAREAERRYPQLRGRFEKRERSSS